MNISSPPIPGAAEEFGNSFIPGLFVDLTDELVKAILVWLRKSETKQTENPKLKMSIGGNLLNINVHDMEILLSILKECSRIKKKQQRKDGKRL